MTSPPTRRRGPQAPPPGPRREASSASKDTPPPPDTQYDQWAPELDGYESDPLTADEWGAICLAEARDLAWAVVDR